MLERSVDPIEEAANGSSEPWRQKVPWLDEFSRGCALRVNAAIFLAFRSLSHLGESDATRSCDDLSPRLPRCVYCLKIL